LGRPRDYFRRRQRCFLQRPAQSARHPTRARHARRLANDFGTAPLLVLGFIVDGNPARFHWTTMSIFCLLYLAVIGSALTFLLLYWLLPRMSVNNLQTISLITPPGAVMLGWLLGGETFPLWSLFGAAFVLIGVWMIFRRNEGPARGRGFATVPDRG